MAVDVSRMISSIPRVSDFPNLESAWVWSLSQRFTFVLALSSDAQCAYQVNMIDSFDADLARHVLEFARERELCELVKSRVLAIAHGFSHSTFDFDSVGVANHTVHGYYVGRNELLNEHVVAVFPAYRCEISGAESTDEAILRFKRMLHPTVMRRSPSPFLRMRYENQKTGGGSHGDQMGFTTWDVLLRELNLLEGAAASFVECENVHGEFRRIEWNGDWIVSGGINDQTLNRQELGTWVAGFLGCKLDAS